MRTLAVTVILASAVPAVAMAQTVAPVAPVVAAPSAAAPVTAAPVVATPAAAAPLTAVTPAPQVAAASIVTLKPASGESVLRVGTPVALRTMEELTTKGKKLKVGQRFNMEVAENLIVNGTTVIPAGSPAVGEIMEVRNKGMWGKSGHLGARIIYLTVNGRQIRLTGAFDDKGTAGGIGATAVSALVFLPAGFFMTGTSALIASGSPVKGFIDEDVPFTAGVNAAAPLVVAAPVAQVPVTAATPAAAAKK